MPQILVWQCPRTSEIFQDGATYREHLKEQARGRMFVHHLRMSRVRVRELHGPTIDRISTVEGIFEYLAANAATMGSFQSLRDQRAYGEPKVSVEVLSVTWDPDNTMWRTRVTWTFQNVPSARHFRRLTDDFFRGITNLSITPGTLADPLQEVDIDNYTVTETRQIRFRRDDNVVIGKCPPPPHYDALYVGDRLRGFILDEDEQAME